MEGVEASLLNLGTRHAGFSRIREGVTHYPRKVDSIACAGFARVHRSYQDTDDLKTRVNEARRREAAH